ncbi:MAG: hypothetical protein QG574_2652 [Cyanobacteriota bacterium erpe_2018_sw_21hr_WHONDRS-SW48-000092_B_bin.40]|nr:hypothetical protein [Cyanobacteriota bacterium erpe_2018_sw_21hr_WHONDRS-SW48-000092_B_bin.40]
MAEHSITPLAVLEKIAALPLNSLRSGVGRGVRLWQVSDAYLGDIGATGDYAKPLNDIAWLGQQIDKRWQAMSPEENWSRCQPS